VQNPVAPAVPSIVTGNAPPPPAAPPVVTVHAAAASETRPSQSTVVYVRERDTASHASMPTSSFGGGYGGGGYAGRVYYVPGPRVPFRQTVPNQINPLGGPVHVSNNTGINTAGIHTGLGGDPRRKMVMP
jgi:hypothetical protein